MKKLSILLIVMLTMLTASSSLAQSKKKADDLPPPPEGTQATDEEPEVDEMALENLMREVLQV